MGHDVRFQARGDGLAWRHVGNEIVILDIQRSLYLTLNETGAVLWETLTNGPATMAELVECVRSAFDVEPGVARSDVEEFLSGCREQGLLDDTD